MSNPSLLAKNNLAVRIMNVFWQCPNCGGILEKRKATLGVVDDVAGLMGSATCSFCGTSHSATQVYEGAFDLAETDEFVRTKGKPGVATVAGPANHNSGLTRAELHQNTHP